MVQKKEPRFLQNSIENRTKKQQSARRELQKYKLQTSIYQPERRILKIF
jgi:hypothetical protein